MGLTVQVGSLANMQDEPHLAEIVQSDIDAMNALLSSNGLPAHVEPVRDREVVTFDIGPYGFLHYLRRVAAHVWLTGQLPDPGDSDADTDPMVVRALAAFGSSGPEVAGGDAGLVPADQGTSFRHLIDHSDADGYYVPVEFESPLHAKPGLPVPGDCVGSSQSLVRELTELAGLLAIPEGLDPEGDELVKAVFEPSRSPTGWQRHAVEAFVCQRLLHAARASVAAGSVLWFF